MRPSPKSDALADKPPRAPRVAVELSNVVAQAMHWPVEHVKRPAQGQQSYVALANRVFPPFQRRFVFPTLICGRRETLSSLQKTSRRRCAGLLSLQIDPRSGRRSLSIYQIRFSTVSEGGVLPHFDLRPSQRGSICPTASRGRCAGLSSLQNDPRNGRRGMSTQQISVSTVSEGVTLGHFDLRPFLEGSVSIISVRDGCLDLFRSPIGFESAQMNGKVAISPQLSSVN